MTSSYRAETPKWLALAPRLVLAALISAAVAMSLLVSRVAVFEVVFEMISTSGGTTQLFYDAGRGFNEADSSRTSIGPSRTPVTVRLPLPAGRFNALRIDPNTGPGDYVMSNLRIEDPSGQVVYRPDQAARLHAAGGAVMTVQGQSIAVMAGADVHDPIVVISLGHPLTLSVTVLHPTTIIMAAILCFALLFGLFTVVDVRAGPRVRSTVTAPQQHTAVVIIACAIAAVAAMYPLLLGRSLVAPSYGVFMLYDQAPWVPGASDFVVEDLRGSDVGAQMWQTLPYSKVQREAISAGEWPLWNRYNGLGRPLWGSGLSAFLDPLHLLSLITEDRATGWDMKFVHARVIFAVGVGLLAHLATGSAGAALVVGIAAPFFGYFSYRLNHPAYFSLIYTPWLLSAFVGLSRAVSAHSVAGWAMLVAIAAALQLVASTPKEGAIVLAVTFATGGFAVLLSPGRNRMWRLGGATGAAVVGLLLSAPHWLVFLDTLSRAWTVYDVPQVRFGSWPLVTALALGASTPDAPVSSANMTIAAGVMLAIFTVPRWWRSSMAVACALMSVGALSIALGAIPAWGLLRVPLIRNVAHVDYTFTAAALIPLTVVAAFGFREAFALLSRTRAASFFAIVAILLGGALVFGAGANALESTASYPALAAVVGALFLPFAVAAWQAQVIGRFALGAVVAASAMTIVPGGLHIDTRVRPIDAVLTQPRPRADLDEESPATEAAKRLTTEPFRAVGVGTTLFPGTQALWGLEGLVGADALELPHFRELGLAAGMFNHPWGWVSLFSVEDMQSQSALLDMFGVRVVFARPEAVVPFGRQVPTRSPDFVKVIERPTAWPRAFFTTGILRYSGPAELLDMLNSGSGPFAATQLGDAHAEELLEGLPDQRGTIVPAETYRLTPNTTTFTVTAQGRGIVLLGEAYEPQDFRAFLNGEPTPYFRANHMYKGLVIPEAGTWTVRFEHRPAMWTASWALASVGALILAAAGVWRRRQRSSIRRLDVPSDRS